MDNFKDSQEVLTVRQLKEFISTLDDNLQIFIPMGEGLVLPLREITKEPINIIDDKNNSSIADVYLFNVNYYNVRGWLFN